MYRCVLCIQEAKYNTRLYGNFVTVHFAENRRYSKIPYTRALNVEMSPFVFLFGKTLLIAWVLVLNTGSQDPKKAVKWIVEHQTFIAT